MAGRYDFEMDQGATFVLPITWQDESGDPVDLAGFTARMHLRSPRNAPDPALELTSENGGIALVADGEIELRIAPAHTSPLAADKVYHYDLELASPTGEVTRLIEGEITLRREVTREST